MAKCGRSDDGGWVGVGEGGGSWVGAAAVGQENAPEDSGAGVIIAVQQCADGSR